MKKVLTYLLIAMSLVAMGCAEKAKDKNPAGGVITDGGSDVAPRGDGPDFSFTDQSKATATFTPVSQSVFEAYATHPVFNPQNMKISLSLQNYDGGYGGSVGISYTSNGVSYSANFSSLDKPGGIVNGNAENNQYNVFFNPEGSSEVVWHGFFEDRLGAIIVVIDEINLLGDGQGPDGQVSGSVWFKNFELAPGPISPTSCWFVKTGPYECRAFKSGGKVRTTSRVYPDQQYTKLGDFTGLDIVQAFNDQIEF